jgi:hypothetical protein
MVFTKFNTSVAGKTLALQAAGVSPSSGQQTLVVDDKGSGDCWSLDEALHKAKGASDKKVVILLLFSSLRRGFFKIPGSLSHRSRASRPPTKSPASLQEVNRLMMMGSVFMLPGSGPPSLTLSGLKLRLKLDARGETCHCIFLPEHAKGGPQPTIECSDCVFESEVSPVFKGEGRALSLP